MATLILTDHIQHYSFRYTKLDSLGIRFAGSHTQHLNRVSLMSQMNLTLSIRNIDFTWIIFNFWILHYSMNPCGIQVFPNSIITNADFRTEVKQWLYEYTDHTFPRWINHLQQTLSNKNKQSCKKSLVKPLKEQILQLVPRVPERIVLALLPTPTMHRPNWIVRISERVAFKLGITAFQNPLAHKKNVIENQAN